MPKWDGLRSVRKTLAQLDTPAMQCARRLLNYLKDKEPDFPNPNLKKWAQRFEKIIKASSPDEVYETLEWYIANCVRLRLLPIESAKGFTMRFNRWRHSMALDPSRVKLTPAQSELHEAWRRKGWPAGLDLYLPLIIQKSWENYDAFWPCVLTVACELKAIGGRKRQLGMLAEWFYNKKCFQAGDFIHFWMLHLHGTLATIPTWNGTVEGLIFSVHGERFTRLGRQWAYEFCEQSAAWDELMVFFKEK